MKVLLTGGEGFLGKLLKKELSKYNLTTLGKSVRNNIVTDITSEIPNLPFFDVVIHGIGLAHKVPKTSEDEKKFFEVNVNGTKNLLNKLELSVPKYFLFISSVSVYGKSDGVLIDENSPLLATDAYGKSKIEAEALVTNWCNKNNVTCTIFRLPLIVGTNPPGNLGEMIDGIKKGYYFNISGGIAHKSMVLGDDIAKFIIAACKIGGIYNLTDACHPSFIELSKIISKQLGKKLPLNLPYWIAKLLALVGDYVWINAPINSNKLKKIISDLTFDDSKARNIGWKPNSVIEYLKNNKI